MKHFPPFPAITPGTNAELLIFNHGRRGSICLETVVSGFPFTGCFPDIVSSIRGDGSEKKSITKDIVLPVGIRSFADQKPGIG